MGDGAQEFAPLKLAQLLSQYSSVGAKSEKQDKYQNFIFSELQRCSFGNFYKATFGWLFFEPIR
jgi:hypothetical protein